MTASTALRLVIGLVTGALVLAGCATGGASPEPLPSSSPSSLPEGIGVPTAPPTATADPVYYTFDGSWERHRVRGVFCTEDDAVFYGSPQDVMAEFRDPGFVFYRDGSIIVSGADESMPEAYIGFSGQGTWDFLIGLDGEPTAIHGTIEAEYATGVAGPGGVHTFTADLDIDVTPHYDDEFAEYCEIIAAGG